MLGRIKLNHVKGPLVFGGTPLGVPKNRIGRTWGKWATIRVAIVCSTSLMASVISSVCGLSKGFCQGLWLAGLNADMIGQSKIDVKLPSNYLITWPFLLHFLHDFCKDSPKDSKAVGGPMMHETFVRCRASRSVKQSRVANFLFTNRVVALPGFIIVTVSQSTFSARFCLPKPLHSHDSFTVPTPSTCCVQFWFCFVLF